MKEAKWAEDLWAMPAWARDKNRIGENFMQILHDIVLVLTN
jgi:hypothetical protein